MHSSLCIRLCLIMYQTTSAYGQNSLAWLLKPCASLAQSAARQSHNLKVVSSSLTGGTFFFSFSQLVALHHNALQVCCYSE